MHPSEGMWSSYGTRILQSATGMRRSAAENLLSFGDVLCEEVQTYPPISSYILLQTYPAASMLTVDLKLSAELSGDRDLAGRSIAGRQRCRQCSTVFPRATALTNSVFRALRHVILQSADWLEG